jgi:hypothetical protein
MPTLLGKIIDFLKSLTTGIFALTMLLLVMTIGSFTMLGTGGYETLNSLPLFLWLRETTIGNSWWLILSLACLGVIALNTVLCSIESLLKKSPAKNLLIKISPQIIHAGFLLILTAHLMSAADSFRSMGPVAEQNAVALSDRAEAHFSDIEASQDSSGFIHGLYSTVTIYENGTYLSRSRIFPNHPAFYEGIGIYLKDARMYPSPAALIEISYDRGAPWALAGGIVFLVGNTLLVLLKLRQNPVRQVDS